MRRSEKKVFPSESFGPGKRRLQKHNIVPSIKLIINVSSTKRFRLILSSNWTLPREDQ